MEKCKFIPKFLRKEQTQCNNFKQKIMKYTATETQKEIPIHFGKNISTNLKIYLSNIEFDKIIIVTDSNINKLWRHKFSKNLKGFEFNFFVFKAGEKSKNLETYDKLCNEILNKGITKKTLLLAFGGGVVGNIAGFIAATLFRGIKFIHIPTTIMSQADSTIGGKQAVNSKHGKNIIGTFYEPEFILIDSQYLETLPKREIKCGIAECIKHALCQDKKLLKELSKKNLEKSFLSKIIKKTIRLKLNLIENDRKEINEGKILIYGHTIGHAIETLSKGKLNHGESISIGMCCTAKISHELGYLDKKDMEKHYKILSAWELPTRIPKHIKVDSLIKQLDYDKKLKNEKIELIVLKEIGKILKSNNKIGISITDNKLENILLECY